MHFKSKNYIFNSLPRPASRRKSKIFVFGRPPRNYCTSRSCPRMIETHNLSSRVFCTHSILHLAPTRLEAQVAFELPQISRRCLRPKRIKQSILGCLILWRSPRRPFWDEDLGPFCGGLARVYDLE